MTRESAPRARTRISTGLDCSHKRSHSLRVGPHSGVMVSFLWSTVVTWTHAQALVRVRVFVLCFVCVLRVRGERREGREGGVGWVGVE